MYAKILGETNFHTREFLQSGSKAKDGEKREKEGNNKVGKGILCCEPILKKPKRDKISKFRKKFKKSSVWYIDKNVKLLIC